MEADSLNICLVLRDLEKLFLAERKNEFSFFSEEEGLWKVDNTAAKLRKQERMVNALALGAEEGRDKLRKA